MNIETKNMSLRHFFKKKCIKYLNSADFQIKFARINLESEKKINLFKKKKNKIIKKKKKKKRKKKKKVTKSKRKKSK